MPAKSVNTNDSRNGNLLHIPSHNQSVATCLSFEMMPGYQEAAFI